MQQNALEKSTKDTFMTWRVVRICDVVDWFIQKTFLFYFKIFFNFWFDVNEKQSIMNRSRYGSKSYASVVLECSPMARETWVQS